MVGSRVVQMDVKRAAQSVEWLVFPMVDTLGSPLVGKMVASKGYALGLLSVARWVGH